MKDNSSTPGTEITITLNGEDQTFLMTYNLLRRLSRLFPSVQDLQLVATNDEVCDKMVATILAGKEKKYDHTKVDLDEVLGDQLPAEIDRLVGWGVAHVTDFFLTRAEKLKTTFANNMDRMEGMMGDIPSP